MTLSQFRTLRGLYNCLFVCMGCITAIRQNCLLFVVVKLSYVSSNRNFPVLRCETIISQLIKANKENDIWQRQWNFTLLGLIKITWFNYKPIFKQLTPAKWLNNLQHEQNDKIACWLSVKGLVIWYVAVSWRHYVCFTKSFNFVQPDCKLLLLPGVS